MIRVLIKTYNVRDVDAAFNCAANGTRIRFKDREGSFVVDRITPSGLGAVIRLIETLPII